MERTMELNYRDKKASVQITFPKISNQKACTEYLVSKTVTKNKATIIENNSINRNATIENYFATKKLIDVEDRLKARKELAAIQRRNLDEQWEELRKKEDDLRDNFIYFDKFIRENFEKKERAQLKLSSMKTLHNTRHQQILETENEFQVMKDTKKCLDNNVARMKIYESFLTEVVEHFPGQFTSIVDILNRYGALMHAQQKMTSVQEQALEQLGRSKNSFDKLVADKYVEIACLKTKLSEMERRYETAHTNCQKWEEIHHVVTLQTQRQLVETEAVKDSCWQIYKDICDRRGVPTVHKGDYPKQFEAIKKDLLQRRLVNERIAELEEEKARLSVKARASSDSA